jgi:hypothetical protein
MFGGVRTCDWQLLTVKRIFSFSSFFDRLLCLFIVAQFDNPFLSQAKSARRSIVPKLRAHDVLQCDPVSLKCARLRSHGQRVRPGGSGLQAPRGRKTSRTLDDDDAIVINLVVVYPQTFHLGINMQSDPSEFVRELVPDPDYVFPVPAGQRWEGGSRRPRFPKAVASGSL